MPFDLEKIQKSTRRVKKFLRKHPKRPSVEVIHDLRTSTRSLETTFITVGMAAKRKVRRLLRELRDVRKRAGKVRDMDVLTADILSLKPDGEQECCVELLEYLGAERTRYAKKLRLAVVADGPQVRQDLKQNSKRLQKLLKQGGNTRLATSEPVPATIARAIQLSSSLTLPARLARKNLHPYRLKVKELRNVLQLSEQPGDKEFVDALGAVKDAIGEWHDWETLRTIADRLLAHGASCKLMKQLEETGNAQFQRALSTTNDFRSRFLKPGKHGARRSNRVSISTPVLRATSAIAA
jgi:CHAD domain-containing protein